MEDSNDPGRGNVSGTVGPGARFSMKSRRDENKAEFFKKLPMEGRKFDHGWKCCGVKEDVIVFSFSFFKFKER